MQTLPDETAIDALADEADACLEACMVSMPHGWTNAPDPVSGWCQAFFAAGAEVSQAGEWVILSMPSGARLVVLADVAVAALAITQSAVCRTAESPHPIHNF